MKAILILVAQFQIWDGLMTQIFVNNGIVSEANPFVTTLVTGGDFLPVKIASALVSISILWIMHKYFPRLTFSAASTMVAFYAAVISWNFFVFFRL